MINKNNLLVLTGDRSSMADLDKAARHVYATAKADKEIPIGHPQRIEFDNGYVLVHAPQITAWEEFKVIEGRAVLEAYSNDGSDTMLATGLFLPFL